MLRGERVLLRPLQDTDAEPLLAAIASSREHLAPWMLWAPAQVSVEDSLLFIRRAQAHWIQRERLRVGIFEIASGNLVGGSGLERIDWQVRSFEIGYWVTLAAQGHGFVQETVQLLTRCAFGELRANRVHIQMDPRNTRSERVPQRLGFVHEGTLHNVYLDADGTPRDRHVYALTPETYARLPWASTR